MSNPNPYPISVTKINAGVSQLAGTEANPCAAGTVRTDVVGTGATALTRSDAATAVIAAGGSGTYKLVVRMSNNASDTCKSQSFVIGDLAASITSAASTTGNNF